MNLESGLFRTAVVAVAAFAAMLVYWRRRGVLWPDAIHRALVAAIVATLFYIVLDIVLYATGFALPGSTASPGG